ncbi:hypothetical protein COCNU_01G005330 [Cocos nucifera]|uniref:Uncharacterized protein n=1 Tax=Cocos nucifera TaxID=13894 RepID=A0A8K0HUW0_COCNU|nr:hypothetical protein COCNU_01G005330 [Cocos nucifera]
MEKGELRGALPREELNQGGIGEEDMEGLKEAWRIVVPVLFSMNVITQAIAGHLGDLKLVVMSIANTIVGFNFGLMVSHPFLSSSFRISLPLFSMHLQLPFV